MCLHMTRNICISRGSDLYSVYSMMLESQSRDFCPAILLETCDIHPDASYSINLHVKGIEANTYPGQ